MPGKGKFTKEFDQAVSTCKRKQRKLGKDPNKCYAFVTSAFKEKGKKIHLQIQNEQIIMLETTVLLSRLEEEPEKHVTEATKLQGEEEKGLKTEDLDVDNKTNEDCGDD